MSQALFIYTLIDKKGQQPENVVKYTNDEIHSLRYDYNVKVEMIEERYAEKIYKSIVIINNGERAEATALEMLNRGRLGCQVDCLLIVDINDNVNMEFRKNLKVYSRGKFFKYKEKPKTKDYFLINGEYYGVK